MNSRVFTVIIIGVMSIFLILYDIFALFVLGGQATISAVLNVWSFEAHPLLMFCLGMVFGGLIVHFFRWKP